MIKQETRTRLRDYSLFFVFLLIPSLIVIEWKRYQWLNCGQHIRKQEQIFNSKIVPKINSPEKILKLINLDKKRYINRLDINSSFFLNDLKNFAKEYDNLSTRRKNKIPPEITEIVAAYNEILKEGELIRDVASCKSAANRTYKEWMIFPLNVLIDAIDKNIYYDRFTL